MNAFPGRDSTRDRPLPRAGAQGRHPPALQAPPPQAVRQAAAPPVGAAELQAWPYASQEMAGSQPGPGERVGWELLILLQQVQVLPLHVMLLQLLLLVLLQT